MLGRLLVPEVLEEQYENEQTTVEQKHRTCTQPLRLLTLADTFALVMAPNGLDKTTGFSQAEIASVSAADAESADLDV